MCVLTPFSCCQVNYAARAAGVRKHMGPKEVGLLINEQQTTVAFRSRHIESSKESGISTWCRPGHC